MGNICRAVLFLGQLTVSCSMETQEKTVVTEEHCKKCIIRYRTSGSAGTGYKYSSLFIFQFPSYGERKEIRMNYKKSFLFLFTLFMLYITCIPCYATTERCYFTVDRTITNATTKFTVAYEGISRYISNGRPDNYNSCDYNGHCKRIERNIKDARLFVTINGKVVFRKNCRDYSDIVTVKINKPKTGDIVRISIKAPGWKTNAKTIVVKKITSFVPSKRSANVKTPDVEFKRNSNGIYTYHVSAKKGQTVIIRNAQKIIRKVKLKKDDTIEGTFIGGALFKSELYIYAIEKGYRSASYIILPRRLSLTDVSYG